MDRVRNAIDRLGLSGREVCVHASMRSFGERIVGGAQAILEAFLDSDCTVMAPAFSDDAYLVRPIRKYMPPRNSCGEDYAYFLQREYRPHAPFDVSSKEIDVDEMGVFAQTVLEHPRSARGYHPLNSFAAVGRRAEWLVEAQTPRDVYAPLKRLCEADGCVLLMGVDLTGATIIHHAEQLAGRTPFVRWALDAKGNEMPVLAGSCSDGFGIFSKMLAPYARTAEVGQSRWVCYNARDIVRVCREAILVNPMITHCGDPECARCRDAVLGGPDISEIFP